MARRRGSSKRAPWPARPATWGGFAFAMRRSSRCTHVRAGNRCCASATKAANTKSKSWHFERDARTGDRGPGAVPGNRGQPGAAPERGRGAEGHAAICAPARTAARQTGPPADHSISRTIGVPPPRCKTECRQSAPYDPARIPRTISAFSFPSSLMRGYCPRRHSGCERDHRL